MVITIDIYFSLNCLQYFSKERSSGVRPEWNTINIESQAVLFLYSYRFPRLVTTSPFCEWRVGSSHRRSGHQSTGSSSWGWCNERNGTFVPEPAKTFLSARDRKRSELKKIPDEATIDIHSILVSSWHFILVTLDTHYHLCLLSKCWYIISSLCQRPCDVHKVVDVLKRHMKTVRHWYWAVPADKIVTNGGLGLEVSIYSCHWSMVFWLFNFVFQSRPSLHHQEIQLRHW
jgi:hypothetical protein